MRIVAWCIAICSLIGFSVPLQAQVDNEPAQKLTAERMFAFDQVSEIRIEIPKKDWDQIRLQSRSFGEALTKDLPEKIFTYVKGDITINGQLIKDVGIRKKGFIGSLNADRPSLKIKFAEYVEQSPVGGLDRLTLNNNNQDPGRICQYLSYKLFRESGTHAPRCGFASVYVNGKHLGVYSNVEPIKSDFLEHSFGDSSGALYEGTVTDFYEDYVDKFETKNKAAKKVEYIQAVVDALAVDQLNDEELEKLNQLVDVDSFIKYWAMESLIGFWDSYCSNQNNYYLYRDPKSGKFHFIPWGADSAFTESSPIPPYRTRPRSVHGKAILPNKIYRNEKARENYKATLMSFVDEHWNEEELIAEIDRLETLLKDHLQEENTGFARSLRGYRRFVKKRRKGIVGEFKKGAPKLARKEQKPTYFAEIGTIEATFSTTWRNGDPGKPGKAELLTLNLNVNGKSIELEDAYVYAQTDDMNRENAAIMIKGKSKSNGKETIIGASLPKSDFLTPSSVPKSAGGVLLQPGMLGMLNPSFKMMFGTIKFEETSSKVGEPVKGVLKMSVGEFNGMGE